MSLFGPVFDFEAKLSARARRLYLIRVIYGILVLLVAMLAYEQARSAFDFRRTRGESPAEMAGIGAGVFREILILEQFAVFGMTPVLVAGAIANDRQRGILINLLASPLSSREIVLSKLGSRVLQVFMLALVGLPILSILALLGGIEPVLLGASFVATASMIWLLAALSILVSVHAARSRDAILLVYVLEAAWFLAPLLLRPLVTIWWTGLFPVAWPILRAIELSNPFGLNELVSRPRDQWGTLYLLIALELVGGVILAALATWRLRKVAPTADEAAPADEPQKARRRPPCGDDPMLWKEVRVARLGPLVRMGCWLIGLPFGLMYAERIVDEAIPAYREVAAEGYGEVDGRDHSARDRLYGTVRQGTMVMFMLWILGSTAAAANGIASEREEDTWESLRSTPLTGAEILRAKRIGALRRFRPLAIGMLLCWTIGLTAGAIHLLAYPWLVLDFLVLSWYAVSLGTFFSLVCRNSTRAAAWSVFILFAANCGGLILAILTPTFRPLAELVMMPQHLSTLIAPDFQIQSLLGRSVSSKPGLRHFSNDLFLAIAGMILHGGIAWMLNAWASSLLDGERPDSTGSTEEEAGERGRGEVGLDQSGGAVEHL